MCIGGGEGGQREERSKRQCIVRPKSPPLSSSFSIFDIENKEKPGRMGERKEFK